VHEVVVPFPSPIVPLSEVRTIVLLSSHDALRKHNLFGAYLARLESHRDALVSMSAGTWVPSDVAVAHYRACDRLGLSQTRAIELGRMVSQATHNVLASTALRMARELGATPWTLFEQADRFWMRAWKGSAISVVRVGPKDAHISIAGMPLATIPYFRFATGGFIAAIAEFVATKAFVRHVASECTENKLGYHLAWA
jgi:hypothetical protein